MGKAGAGIGLSGGFGAVGGAVGAAFAGLTLGASLLLIGVTAALGAGLAAASWALNRVPNDNKRKTNDVIQTDSIHILPVPVLFGRSRSGGNWIAVGQFDVIDPKLVGETGRLRKLHGVLGLGEGGPSGMLAMGNVWQDGQTLEALALASKFLVVTGYHYVAERGTSTQIADISASVSVSFTSGHHLSGPVADQEPVTGATSGATGTSAVVALVGAVNMTITRATTTNFQVGEQINFSSGAHAVIATMRIEESGYPEPIVPWRNTAVLIARTIVGPIARMPAVNIDLFGPDYTIRRSGSTSETANADSVGYAFFDSYSDYFYYTLTGSTHTSTPFGLMGTGRQGQARVHTQPPTAVSSNVSHAWYLGRHDVLVMQDPSDSSAFWVGTWALPRSDPNWEKVHPSDRQGGPGYENAILVHYLDEVSGILHTLHTDGTTYYVLRWWLLTGRFERQNTNLASGTYAAMIWSPDLNCYIFASGSARLDFVETDGGTIFNTVTTLSTTGCKGLCVTGQMVGVIVNNACTYYDPTHLQVKGPFGTSATDTSLGALGSLASVHQNSFTGHVTLGRNDGTDAFLVNFIPSIPEDRRDLDANGSAGLGGLPDPVLPTDKRTEPDFQDFGPSGAFETGNTSWGWVRDWSYRKYNSWNLVSLQGFSGLAAAAWATLVDEPNLDSRRWGCGLKAKYFNLGSFEGLHWYCVGPAQFSNPGGDVRYAERFKFDFLLDQEQSASIVVADEILIACQGYRTSTAGIMSVGVEKSGAWPVWHFSEKTINAESDGSSSLSIAFAGRTDAPNRVRVQYRDILNEYSHDYAEANDEWDQNSLGKIQTSTVTAEGCARFDSADMLARSILDNAKGARRQLSFKTHFTGLLLSPGDVIEVSDSRCALNRLPCKIVAIVEQGGDQSLEISAIEHRPTLDALSANIVPSSTPGSGSIDGGTDGCNTVEAPADSTSINWVNNGATFAPGTLTITYLGGTYAPDGTWNFAVAGYEFVTGSPASPVVLGNAPGESASAPGWPDQGSAEQANFGDPPVTFSLGTAGPVGIRRIGGGGVTPAGTNYPTYQVCLG